MRSVRDAVASTIMSNESGYLGGRVLHRRSVVYEGRPPADAPALKRLRLPQGDLGQVVNGEPAMKYLAWLEMRVGSVRGNHRHERKLEYVYAIDCALRAHCEDVTSRERVVIPVEPGDLLFIPPGIGHALETLRGGYAVELAPHELDVSDSYPYPMGVQASAAG